MQTSQHQYRKIPDELQGIITSVIEMGKIALSNTESSVAAGHYYFNENHAAKLKEQGVSPTYCLLQHDNSTHQYTYAISHDNKDRAICLGSYEQQWGCVVEIGIATKIS